MPTSYTFDESSGVDRWPELCQLPIAAGRRLGLDCLNCGLVFHAVLDAQLPYISWGYLPSYSRLEGIKVFVPAPLELCFLS